MPFVKMNPKKQAQSKILDARRVFVGREQELHFFRKHVLEPETPDHNIISISGEGGVGKTTLLERFLDEAYSTGYKEYCQVARVDERKITPVGIIETFAEQLKLAGTLEKALAQYKEALRKLQDEREQTQEAIGRKATNVIVTTAAKGIPVVGDLLGQGAQLASDFLWDEFGYRQRLKDARHLENPLHDLTHAFVTELNKLVAHQFAGPLEHSRRSPRILLCFDTFEHLASEITPWLLDHFLPSDIDENIVLIIAGRYPLNRSATDDPKRWLEYIDQGIMHFIVLVSFTERETRHYLEERGITDSTRITHIWQLSRGLPLYLSILTANPMGEIDPTADVVDNYLRWIPEQEQAKRRLALDIALLSCPFNRDDLKAFSHISDEERPTLYRWLTQQPFVRSDFKDGRHTYHEVAQEMFGRYLYTSSPEDCRMTRRTLAEHYRRRLVAVEEEEGENAAGTEQWFELAMALMQQLLFLPEEEGHVKAVELTVLAQSQWGQGEIIEEINKTLQEMKSGFKKIQMANIALGVEPR